MIPPTPRIPAAIPPTTAPVEMVVPEPEAFPFVPEEEGLDERELVLDRVNEVVKMDDL